MLGWWEKRGNLNFLCSDAQGVPTLRNYGLAPSASKTTLEKLIGDLETGLWVTLRGHTPTWREEEEDLWFF